MEFEIPQGRKDVLAFRLRIGRELIKEGWSGGRDADSENDCILLYEEWHQADAYRIKNLKAAAAEALKLHQNPKETRTLREILQSFMFSNRHNYGDVLLCISPQYLGKLIVEIQENRSPIVLREFVEFLEKYL